MTQLKGLATLAVIAWVLLFASTASRATGSGYATGDMVLGDPNAPVTVIEYASMTCPHCATFHNGAFKTLKTSYIDTGKVRMIFREFPFDGVALRASMLARCSGPSRFFGMIDVMFRQQSKWTAAEDPVSALRKLARLSGMTNESIDACMQDQTLADSILQTRLQGSQEFGIDSTPSFVINGTKYSGAMAMAEWDEILGKLLN